MITSLHIPVDSGLLSRALSDIPEIDFRLTLNQPTGDFFYNAWQIRPEFKGTVWDDILKTLPYPLGEARLIKLNKGTCYTEHADIDDRWHLSIVKGNSYLVDLENHTLHDVKLGEWYDMDAGRQHSAVNFGGEDRIQLVVRQLLTRGTLDNPRDYQIKFDTTVSNWRYVFDHVYSPMLNRLNKQSKLDNFKLYGDSVSFTAEDGLRLPQHNIFEIIK